MEEFQLLAVEIGSEGGIREVQYTQRIHFCVEKIERQSQKQETNLLQVERGGERFPYLPVAPRAE